MSSYLRRGLALGVLVGAATLAQGQVNSDLEQFQRFQRQWPSLCKQLVEQLSRADDALRSITAHSPLSEAAVCDCVAARMRDDKYLKNLLNGDVSQARTLMQVQGFQPYFAGKMAAFAAACFAIELERSVDSLIPSSAARDATTKPTPTAPAALCAPAVSDIPAAEPVTGNALVDALNAGDLQRARGLLEAGVDVDARDSGGNTPLFCAAGGAKEIVELLIAHGADVNATNANGFAPLHSAAYHSRKEAAELLLRKGAAVNVKSAAGFTPLHKAMERLGNPKMTPQASPSDVEAMVGVVELLLAHGADVGARYSNDATPLHMAAAIGQPILIEMLIAKGANINARSKEGDTPLHVAANLDRAKAVETLIARGAEIDVRTARGYTALIVAAGEGHFGPAEILVAHGADVNARDATGKSPLVWALSAAAFVSPSGQKIGAIANATRSAAEKQKWLEAVESVKSTKGQWREIAILLIKHRAQTNAGPEVDQPLFFAALIGDAELVTELVEHGADIDDAKGGETALHCAIAEMHKEAAIVLINKGANLSAQSIRRGLTPLHFLAGKFDDRELAELMIQRGANVNARDKQGITPLRYALMAKNNQVADVLKRNGGR